VGVGASAGSPSDPRGLAQSYVLAFNSPSPDVSLSSSVGSLPSSPSPAQATSPLAAYRGRRAATGRTSLLALGFLPGLIIDLFLYVILISFWSAAIGALDGSLLARLTQGDSDSDADE
jgi:hypothetical protein